MLKKLFIILIVLAISSFFTSVGWTQLSIYKFFSESFTGFNQETLNKARAGQARSQLEVGLAYYFGRGVPVNYTEGLSWIYRAALNGSAAAQYQLGLALEEGLGIPQSFTWAFYWFELAAERGYAPAMNRAGQAYMSGLGTDLNPSKAFNLFSQAAKKGLPEAIVNLGKLYEAGSGVEPDQDRAIDLYKQAAKLGSSYAKFLLAYFEEYKKQARSTNEPWLEPRLKIALELAKQFSADQVYEMAIGHYWITSDGFKLNSPILTTLLELAVEKGQPEAMYRLAEYYLFANQENFHWEDRLFSEPEKLDWEKSFDLFERAYKAGCLKASLRLAQSYENGWGVKPDPQLELSWLKKAHEHGLNGAATALGVKYLYGLGLPKDERKAFELFYSDTKIMLAGETALYLSQAYDLGIGVPMSREQSYKIRLLADNFPKLAEYQVYFPYTPLRPMLASDLELTESLRRNAERGVAGAQFSLGSIYWLGLGIPMDRDLAAQWWAKAAEQGVFMAQFNMGLLSFAADLDGPVPLDQNSEQAFKWFLLAAEQGELNSQKFVAWAYYTGEGVDPDPAMGFFWYQKAAAQGDAEATFNLGWAYEFGRGVEFNPIQALSWYKAASEIGLAWANYKVGLFYYYGLHGVAKDLKKGFKEIDTAAGKHMFDPLYIVDLAYEKGQGRVFDRHYPAVLMESMRNSPIHNNTLRNKRLILDFMVTTYKNRRLIDLEKYPWREILQEASFSGGSVEARYILGRELDLGFHGPRDKAKALVMFKLAAQGGHLKAQERVGWAYDQGYGVEIDEAKAFDWFMKAANQGLPMSQYKTGIALLKGYGVKADPQNGLAWIELAAKKGLSIAQYELGLAYQRGEAVTKDATKAGQWFELAKQNGFTQKQYNMGVRYLELEATLDSVDFNYDLSLTQNCSFKSTSIIVAKFFREGQEIVTSEPVRWSAQIVKNPSQIWWLRGPRDLNGLIWGKFEDCPYQSLKWLRDELWNEKAVKGQASTNRVAHLSDVVGERTVRLSASTNIDGVDYLGSTEVTFGKGPLSIFTSPIIQNPELNIEVKREERFSKDSVRFPAVSDFCRGSLDGIDWALANNGDDFQHYVKGSNLPDRDDLAKLSLFYESGMAGVAREKFGAGAGFAAGWPTGDYLSGQIKVDFRYRQFSFLKVYFRTSSDKRNNYLVCAEGLYDN
ncbi:MAG: sel1 repeat family protein [Deltaproteobacteria bacterium]|jgi:TPR repeat protein|nr:sel1 repeat family protein [Deltaproteobacteria bacterium]